MNKDVIYVDVEDDITAIIGKVKSAKEKIVALVPPKRIGVLQSAVNLHLLARAAKQADKRLVLITNNAALGALASAAQVPVAKNLQSKPEMAEISALEVDNGEDVIDGAQLPVGELAKTAGPSSLGAAAIDNPAIDEAVRENAAEMPRATPPAPGQSPRKPRAKSGVKVPNFNKFRKKLVFLIGGGVLLVAFLIWAIFFAPHAKVIITARTTDSAANEKVTLGDALATDASAKTIKTTTQQIKKDASVEFDATGSKEVGDKSQGQVVFKNCESMSAQTIPAGTAISANGRTYVTQAAASVPGGTGGFGGCSSPGVSDAVSISAKDIGEDYNTPSNTTFSVSGHPSGSSTVYFNAVASTDITGGSKKTIKTVSSGDVQKASDQLAQQNSDELKDQLKAKFNSEFIVLEQSFSTDKGTPESTPAIGQEAPDGKAKLTVTVTYALAAVAKTEASHFLDDYFKAQIDGKNDRRVYDNGTSGVNFSDVTKSKNGYAADLVATAKIGPKIDDNNIKELAKGKRYGEIQSSIESIEGVDDVDIKFSPFWVSIAPNDVKKISVDFNLNGSK